MKSPRLLVTLSIIGWFFLVIMTFVIVTVPAEGRLIDLLPDMFWKLREVIYPLFFSPWLN
jgi:hypothetical protein